MFQTTYQLGAFVVLTFSGPWEGITKKQSFDEAKDQPEGRLEQWPFNTNPGAVSWISMESFL